MALIHTHSCECTNNELDLFSIPPTQTSLERGQWIEYRPLASVDDHSPIEFHISGSGEDYFDLNNSYIHLKAKIVKADGNPCEEKDKVGPVNLWLHSLFSRVDLSLNEKMITPSVDTYPYRAYLETLLTFGKEAKSTHLQTALWKKDKRGRMDQGPEVTEDGNTGLIERMTLTALSKPVDLMGKLHLDLFFQDRYLVNKVDVNIRLVRSKPAFCLMTAGEGAYKIMLSDVVFLVRHIKLSPTLQLNHIKTLEKTSAKYPLRRIETRAFSVPKGNLTANRDNLFLGQIPKRVVIGCVDNDACNGSYKKNPYNFKNHHINSMAVYVDGHQIPTKPFQPNFKEAQYTRSYLSLFMGTGMMYQDEGNHIDPVDYANGYTLFCLDLTPDLSAGDGGHFNLIKQGNMRLEINFVDALSQTINVIVYAEFDNMLEIDRHRNIMFDYSA